MSEDRLSRLEALVQSALARPEHERAAFVGDACAGDHELRDEVFALLQHQESAAEFLEGSANEGRAPLTPGHELGPYRIEALVGAGGMGEVYRATDTRLARAVAIKILPSDVASDPDRLRRFEREARAIAALKHPNICTIYDVGEREGIRFLVMELLEGETLADRLARGPLPFDEALQRGIEIAGALDRAHRAGIVHRDLKPGNIMLARASSGKSGATEIKLLDFGLARMHATDRASQPTLVTEPGVMLGTLQYMSPEQIEGRDSDPRSDIFAFGAVLFEMLTGRRAFEGETRARLAASILSETPLPVSKLQPRVTPEIDRIVSRCLEKDPDDRWQTARDLRSDLEFAAEARARVQIPGPSRRWRIVAPAAIAVFVLLVAGVVGRGWWRAPAAADSDRRAQFTITLPASVRSVEALAVSPDGSHLAFSVGNQLWVHEIASGTTRAVQGVGPEPLAYPFWSPDGRFIAYFQTSPNSLMKIPAAGGISEKICDLETAARGGTWGSEDTIVFAQVRAGLYRVPAAGGRPVRITNLEQGETAHLWPHFLSDGTRFTYKTFEEQNKVYLASLDPSEPRRLLETTQRTSRAFVFSDFVLTAERRTLRARKLTSTGSPAAALPLAQNIQESGVSGDSLFSASPAVLAYGVEKPRRSQFSVVDRRGRETAAIGRPVWLELRRGPSWSLSPDGRTLAFTQIASDRTTDIALLDLARSVPDRFTFGSGDERLPLWTRSSDHVVFAAGTGFQIKRLGTDTESQLAGSGAVRGVAHDWHRDGTLLYGEQTGPTTNLYNFWVLPPGPAAKPRHWLPAKANHVGAQFSPDGRWVVYVSNETGRAEVYVRRFPEADKQTRVSWAGGERPRWGPDGKGLYYIQEDVLMEVQLEIAETAKPGAPRPLFQIGTQDLQCGFAVMPPPGQRFVVCRPIDPVVPPTITIVLNWAAGLRE